MRRILTSLCWFCLLACRMIAEGGIYENRFGNHQRVFLQSVEQIFRASEDCAHHQHHGRLCGVGGSGRVRRVVLVLSHHHLGDGRLTLPGGHQLEGNPAEQRGAFRLPQSHRGQSLCGRPFQTKLERSGRGRAESGRLSFLLHVQQRRRPGKKFHCHRAERKRRIAPAIDIESSVTQESDFKQQVADYVKLVQAHYGQKPVFYVSARMFDLLYDQFSDYPFWIINYKTKPNIKDWTFWQYSEKGKLPGVDGSVDLDRYHGSRFAFYFLSL
ncbi:hypothetical protein CN246_00040 [Ethanoligenens harbinense]|nr:GH25 family lysozyme [Ethanoligenens harbinense]AYF40189.1 hypothetical protein CN246_00040 [Ethanoligenens harbinense]